MVNTSATRTGPKKPTPGNVKSAVTPVKTGGKRMYRDMWGGWVDDTEDCPHCGGILVTEVDANYGADRDGNRGIRVEYQYCQDCERSPNE